MTCVSACCRAALTSSAVCGTGRFAAASADSSGVAASRSVAAGGAAGTTASVKARCSFARSASRSATKSCAVPFSGGMCSSQAGRRVLPQGLDRRVREGRRMGAGGSGPPAAPGRGERLGRTGR